MTEDQLIEKAAKALYEANWGDDFTFEEDRDHWMNQARAALAVFEKAHTPLLNRVRAEALREAHADLQAYTDSGAPFGHRPVEEFLLHRADRIEQNSEGNET